MENLHNIIQALRRMNRSEPAMLATIIHVEGSAYRKEGTTMLVDKNGSMTGVLSGGCLEQDVAARTEEVWKYGARTVEYDMRGYDPLSWGEGSGCNGSVLVHMEPLRTEEVDRLFTIEALLQEGKEAAVLRVEKGTQLETFLVPAGEIPVGQKTGRFIAPSGEVMYAQLIKPKRRLVIFGAGTDVEPLVHMASMSGFSVILADWRKERCQKRIHPSADAVYCGFPEKLAEQVPVSASDFVLLMTHHFQYDKELLESLIPRRPAYLGILGSKARAERLRDGQELPEWVTSPIGLSIKAEGPEEIAVSILAEIIPLSKHAAIKEAAG
ncbi:molybdenum cofactor sulfurylase [Sinobaca qinghaiensis]|uniref:Molybdenum cofactor sulfurylase n=1 Tax=Sinobaca qinghaiensis TaxID=342944 RepID=A0A419UZV9_9BACL|nr:XdhC family protein [Sinobaca qinghaiensis]RKD71246.1 molybdenum cofactor sulfurylase [Sinobaca qinghaiensis]